MSLLIFKVQISSICTNYLNMTTIYTYESHMCHHVNLSIVKILYFLHQSTTPSITYTFHNIFIVDKFILYL